MGAVAERFVGVGVRNRTGRVQQRDDVLVGVGDEELPAIAQKRHVKPHGLPEVGVGQGIGIQGVVLRDLLETIVNEKLVPHECIAFIDHLLEAAAKVVVGELQAGGSLGGGDGGVLRVHPIAGDHLREAVVAVEPFRAIGKIHLRPAVRHIVNIADGIDFASRKTQAWMPPFYLKRKAFISLHKQQINNLQ